MNVQNDRAAAGDANAGHGMYDAQGKLREDKARKAYLDMLERFHYPIPKRLREELFVTDLGVGDFWNVGIGGIMWCNSQEYGYFSYEIMLLPGQMIPEHWHIESEGGPAKMETWHTRYGMIYTFGEGEPTEPCPVEVPASQKDFITVHHCEPLELGQVRPLNRLSAKHYMIAGPKGAVVTEYASYHDDDALRFTDPKASF